MKIGTQIIILGISFLLILILVALIYASFYFYRVAIKRNKKDFLSGNKDLTPNVEDAKATSNPVTDKVELTGPAWVNTQTYDTWELNSNDGLKLRAYYIPAKVATPKTVILAHGYSSKGKDMGTFAKFYFENLGYNVLMPDARGHGESEGNYIGFGWPDRMDYLLWIKKVINVVGPETKIVLHGISMGGATVMMVSGEELPPQVKVIVEDCGYTTVYDQLSYQLDRLYHLPSFPILSSTSILTDLKVGYNFYEASSLKQVEKNKVPMLFIHGGNDTFVPTEMVNKVYDACQVDKDIFIIDNAGHGMSYTIDRIGYETKVIEFISKYIK